MFHGTLNENTQQGLALLRERIGEENIPASQLDETINIATWNIREFGKKPRREDSIHYIAEIVYQFDLIAITELRDNISDLARLMEILGPYWRVVFSDFTPDRGGNKERMAYLYDNRALKFTGLAAEADAPRKKNHETGEYLPEFDWWRPPFMASFRAGNFDFVIIAAHIRWGDKKEDRIKPLQLLAEWIDTRRQSEHNIDDDIILLGDFNIPSFDDDLYKAICSKGLRAPQAILREELGSNLARNKRYDQIFHYPIYNETLFNEGGVLDFYRDDHAALYPGTEIDKTKFTYELSDHLPLWVQINVDSEYSSLNQKLRFIA
jgi:endonuclease/exonuclease/phosphatase family metal-dependent hydrolase